MSIANYAGTSEEKQDNLNELNFATIEYTKMWILNCIEIIDCSYTLYIETKADKKMEKEIKIISSLYTCIA